MNRLLLGIVIGALGIFAYQRANRPEITAPVPAREDEPQIQFVERPDPPTAQVSESSTFRCDGRTYCSQMTSCEEAMFFLQNCPGVKMDGEGDGVPCEKQWCGHQ